ncbi:winged helix-turn-helix transcriptional regulator [Bacteroidales bacterium]|uniref:Winged helix-turn-helix transcriptional regulator n=1 Tax=Lepagella muris TaxID=3032870 RepID=A0AC61RBC4_9BACT|nr:winged helix-turn-helix transcriptional regulator [Lepagella muris]THG49514.1 winged helix-turn-helix transcriptional regulator [Bacteroidales bacterium]TKC54796.1 winged helix-turn-helix transcriptional regulator [Bacteroidales bacterium]
MKSFPSFIHRGTGWCNSHYPTRNFHVNKRRPKTDTNRFVPNQNRTKTEQKNQIIDLIRTNVLITRIELAKQLGLHESSVQRRLDALVREGRLHHIGPTNGGSWEVIE